MNWDPGQSSESIRAQARPTCGSPGVSCGSLRRQRHWWRPQGIPISVSSWAAKAVLRGSLQPHNLTSGNKEKHLKQPNLTYEATRERINKIQINQKEKTIKITAEINEIKTKKIENINETKTQFFGKIKKIDKPLVRSSEKKRELKSIKLEIKKS